MAAAGKARTIRVALAAAHPLAREEFARALAPGPAAKPGAKQARGESRIIVLPPESPKESAKESGSRAAGAPAEAPDVIIVDMAGTPAEAEARLVPILSGLAAAHAPAVAGAGRSIGARLLLVAGEYREEQSLAWLGRGARGLLTHAEARTRLVEAVRVVAGGGYWVPRATLSHFVENVLEAGPPKVRLPAVQAAARPDVAAGRVRLSRREQEVMAALLENLSNKEIAAKFNLTERTIKFHVSNVLAKFGVRRRADLILLHYQSR